MLGTRWEIASVLQGRSCRHLQIDSSVDIAMDPLCWILSTTDVRLCYLAKHLRVSFWYMNHVRNTIWWKQFWETKEIGQTVIVSSLIDYGQEISETDVAKNEYSTTHLRGSCLPLNRKAIWLIRRHCPGDNKMFCSLLNLPFTDLLDPYMTAVHQLPVWVLTDGYFFVLRVQ